MQQQHGTTRIGYLSIMSAPNQSVNLALSQSMQPTWHVVRQINANRHVKTVPATGAVTLWHAKCCNCLLSPQSCNMHKRTRPPSWSTVNCLFRCQSNQRGFLVSILVSAFFIFELSIAFVYCINLHEAATCNTTNSIPGPARLTRHCFGNKISQ